ncbi:transcription factor jumonji (jmjC) domain protein [Spatholobus suberectus]|nr:transcription factor jumonji (jmjC) domain protein [Spatholobus suberectus]
MSAMEKRVVQIFERKKRIIDQSRQQCHLWEHHLFPKLLLNGIPPPPWLCNSSLHADPQELNKDDLVSEVLLSQPQYRVPFPGGCSNLGAGSYGVQYPIGLHNEGCALEKDCNAGDGVSNLPDCSVNNVVCASSCPPELDSGAVSPQNQIEASASDSHHDPALSLAKLQRSKSRQRALELRNSAKAPKRLSGEDNDAGVCAGAVAGSAPSTEQAEHVMESGMVKDFHSNIQSCSMEEMARCDCVTQKDNESNYSGRITRSKSSSQKFNSLNAASSSVAKGDGSPSNHLNESLEIINQTCFANGSGMNEANKGEYQSKAAGKSVCDERLIKSRSSSRARYNSELLKLDSTLGSGKGVEICDLMQPVTHAELTDLSKASDCNNGSGRNTVKDGNFCLNKQESDIHSTIKLLRSSCPSPGHDLLMTGGSVKSIDKSAQSPQPLISQNSQDPVVSVVGSFSSQKDPDFCAVKPKERLSRSGSGQVEKVLKSSRSNFCEKSATCSESAGKKSWNVQPTKLDARRLSSSPKHSELGIEIDRNSAEKENVAALAASGDTRGVTTCANEVSLRPVNSSNFDGGSLLAESVYIETAADEKVLDAQENIPSGAIPIDNTEHRSAAIVGKVDADFDGLVEKDPSCFTLKVGLNVSVLKLPSDFIMSVMPKQLDFDDVEETSMNGICSPDLKEGQQGVPPEEEPLKSLEPVNLLEEETSPVCQSKHNSSGEMPSLQMQELLIREEGPHMEHCASHFEKEDIARTTLSAMSPNKEIPVFQNESLMNHSSPLQVAGENSSRNLSKEVMPTKFVLVNSKLKNYESSAKLAGSSSEAVTGNDLHKYTDENVTNFTVGFPFSAPMDDVNVGLAQQVPNSITLCEDGDLLQQTLLGDGKITSFSTDCQIFRNSTESFTYDMEHSCPQHKRRKIEIEREKFLPASSNLLEKQHDSIDQRPISRNLNIEEDNPEVALEVQHLPSDQDDDIGHQYISNSPMDEMQHNGECQTVEDSSLEVRKEEKLFLDGTDRSEETLLLAVANPSDFSIDSTMRCTMNEKVESWQHQVNCGQESAELLSCVERSTSSRRIYPGGIAKFSDGMSASPEMQCLDLVGTDEALPEFEGFIMQTDNTQPCIAGDQMDLEKMNLPSNSIDYTSLDKSRFIHSPLCNSLTPYKLHNIPELYQSLPNGLLEGLGIRSSLPLSDGSPRSLSDCQPNCKGQYTSSVQTLWDRMNSNFGSSGKRKSLKLDLPSITEENENVDEIAGTFQRGIDSEGMAGSNIREPLAEIVDNANPSTSVLQDDILTCGHEDVVSTKFNLSGTFNKVKNKLDRQAGNRRFTRKGKENQNISLGANGVKRTTESVCKRPSRPKLSGKDSMKQGTINNIVSNISSFIPLVQQKQAASVVTGKRDIKVKALEAAEAAKRMAEKKENERKMKKEVLRLEREKLELELQKKKKEEERKKKEAQMAAKKRQREDEGKKEKEKKRKRVNDMKKQQQEYEKILAKKEEIEIQRRATGEEVRENKKFMDERENHKNLPVQDNREGNMEKISETEPLAMRDLANDKSKEPHSELSESVNDCADNGKVMDNFIKATEDDDLIIKNSLQEQSYEISPYRGSDDEDEDEDDMPNNKFIPSWASKRSLSLIVSSQKMDPETIFPPQSFCNIAEVLLPRRLQLR